MVFRKLRFREPVDDRSPEPNNNDESKSEEATINPPVESIPDIDPDIDSYLRDLQRYLNPKSKVSVVSKAHSR